LQQISDAVSALPGIQSAGLVYEIPLAAGGTNGSISIQGRQGEDLNSDKQYIGGSYFQALRIPLLKGRFFDSRDTADSPKAVIINRTFARQFFPNQDPIGKRVDVSWGDTGWCEVIGVVGDTKLTNLAAANRPSTFMLYAQNAPILQFLGVNLVVRTSQEPVSAVQSIRSAIQKIDRNQPLDEIKTMDDLLSESLAPQRAPMWLVGGFSAIALFLAAIGIYGVLSYFVVQRSQEIGMRMALGAQRGNVLALILRQGARLIAIGVGAGLVGALIAARALTSLLFGIKPTDLPTFVGVSVLLSALALVACAV